MRHPMPAEMQIRPLQLMSQRMSGIQPARIGRMDRPGMMGMGMPLFLGYYVRDNEEGGDRSGMLDGLDPFNF